MFFLRNAQSNFEGYSTIGWFNAYVSASRERTIDIDCSQLSWFDANLSAPLGAVMRRNNGAEAREFRFHSMDPAVRSILCDNGLIEGDRRSDRGTVIPLEHFASGQAESFAQYSKHHLEGKGIPAMSKALRTHFYEGIDEVFQNADIHSESAEGVFASGQLYPKRKKLDFCVADMGIGIPAVVRRGTGLKLSAADAIDWAMTGHNTTRKGDIPGGLGLKILKEFISKNRGRLIVVSHEGYWEMTATGLARRELPAAYPGTAVTVEVNTADGNIYKLSSEINPAEIF